MRSQPLLFNIFLADLAKTLDEMENQVKIGDMDINSLFWADDIIMFAKSENELRECLKFLKTIRRKISYKSTQTKQKLWCLIKQVDS